MTRREARDKAYEAAVRSGDRAYCYRLLGDGNLEEVRVWPNGRATYTAVAPSGASQAGPRVAITRVGGLRNNLRVPSPAIVTAVGFVALLLERIV